MAVERAFRIALLEDDQGYLKVSERYYKNRRNDIEVQPYNDPKQFEKHIAKCKQYELPDIIFLDSRLRIENKYEKFLEKDIILTAPKNAEKNLKISSIKNEVQAQVASSQELVLGPAIGRILLLNPKTQNIPVVHYTQYGGHEKEVSDIHIELEALRHYYEMLRDTNKKEIFISHHNGTPQMPLSNFISVNSDQYGSRIIHITRPNFDEMLTKIFRNSSSSKCIKLVTQTEYEFTPPNKSDLIGINIDKVYLNGHHPKSIEYGNNYATVLLVFDNTATKIEESPRSKDQNPIRNWSYLKITNQSGKRWTFGVDVQH